MKTSPQDALQALAALHKAPVADPIVAGTASHAGNAGNAGTAGIKKFTIRLDEELLGACAPHTYANSQQVTGTAHYQHGQPAHLLKQSNKAKQSLITETNTSLSIVTSSRKAHSNEQAI